MEIEISWKKLFIIISTCIALFQVYKKFIFPVLLDNLMKSIHKAIQNGIKKKAFREAFELVRSENGSSDEKERPLQILEIGIGSGENFKYFPEDAKLSYLDKTDAFMPFLRQSLEKEKRDQEGVKLIVASAENMAQIESNSKDVVVHTFILCSVDDPYLVLKEIHRVLKPGGVCVFIEHSLDSENTMRRLFQTLIAPLWYCLIDCRFRPIKSILEAGKYDSLKIDFHRENGLVSSIINPYVYGIGTKLKV